jgi:hypothetical protein
MKDENDHLFIGLYLDEDVYKKAAIELRRKGFDVVSAHEIGNRGLSDQDQLEYAISQKRTIFSFNVSDFTKLHREYVLISKEHYGIVVSKRLSISETLNRILGLLDKVSSDDLKNMLLWL